MNFDNKVLDELTQRAKDGPFEPLAPEDVLER